MSSIKILLWSLKGAGPQYHGPGMNAWRLYSTLKPEDGAVSLLHGCCNASTDQSAPWERVVDVSNANRGFFNVLISTFRAARYVRQHANDFHVVHLLTAYYPSVILALVAEYSGLPAVIKVAANGTEVNGDVRLYTIHRLVRYWAMRRISAFVAISEEIKESLIRLGIPASKVLLVPNGVDTDRFYPPRTIRTPRITRRILFAGALVRRKRPHLLLMAIQRLSNSSDVKIIFAGPAKDKKYSHELNEVVNRFGLAENVEWAGFVKDMPALTREVDVLCLPSAGEGMANVVLEAMASGVPFVVTPASGMAELARTGGGIVVDPVPSKIAEGLETALRQKEIFAAKGRAAALERYSTGSVLKQHLRLFGQLRQITWKEAKTQ